MGQSWSRWNNHRSAKTLAELAPRITPGEEEPTPNLDRNTLQAALSRVAASIAKRNGNITVIAVGGAVNTIYLRSRDSTHDVDFFNNYLTPKDFEFLVTGAREAARQDSNLREEWFNNRTILFIPNDQRQSLTDEALKQHEVIFEEPGLTVLAAPWNYAFCCKVDRLSGGGCCGARQYDLDDATDYLSRHLAKIEATSIPRSTVQEWFTRYSLRWTAETETVIARVVKEYAARFNVDHDVIVGEDMELN